MNNNGYDDEGMMTMEEINGVLLKRSIRSCYGTLHVARLTEISNKSQCDDTVEPVPTTTTTTTTTTKTTAAAAAATTSETTTTMSYVQVVVFYGNRSEARSELRRFCRIGDFIRARGRWSVTRQTTEGPRRLDVSDEDPPKDDSSSLTSSRFSESMKVLRLQYWNAEKCQRVRDELLCCSSSSSSSSNAKTKTKEEEEKKEGGTDEADGQEEVKLPQTTSLSLSSCRSRSRSRQNPPTNKRRTKMHGTGGGIGKKLQGERVAEFFVQMMMAATEQFLSSSDDDNDNDNDDDDNDDRSQRTLLRLRRRLNDGSGVLDVAGGAGHVSLALASRGIRATVVDPRENVGRLPRAIRRAGVRNNGDGDAIAFASKRAWFMARPDYGHNYFHNNSINTDMIDTDNTTTKKTNHGKDHPDNVPVCTACSPDGLLAGATALVGLHPDEATESIVDFAVEHSVPFVVVPCCVFSALFPHRWSPRDGTPVTTYSEFVRYLTEKHESIRTTALDFEGANLALWSTFC